MKLTYSLENTEQDFNILIMSGDIHSPTNGFFDNYDRDEDYQIKETEDDKIDEMSDKLDDILTTHNDDTEEDYIDTEKEDLVTTTAIRDICSIASDNSNNCLSNSGLKIASVVVESILNRNNIKISSKIFPSIESYGSVISKKESTASVCNKLNKLLKSFNNK